MGKTTLYLALKVSFRVAHEEIKKYTLCIIFFFFRGQIKLGPRPDWSPLGVQFKISDEHRHPFYMGVLPGIVIIKGSAEPLEVYCKGVGDNPSNLAAPSPACHLLDSNGPPLYQSAHVTNKNRLNI